MSKNLGYDDDYILLNQRGVGDWQRIVYENLANAIIKKACKDYVALGNKSDATLIGDGSNNRVNKAEILHFFRSQWFRELTDVDPEYLIAGLDEIVKEREKATKRSRD